MSDKVKKILNTLKKGFIFIEKWMKLFKIQKRDYQLQAMKWCIAKENGFHVTFDKKGQISGNPVTTQKSGLIADEMGLGKTIVILGTWVGNFKKNTLIVLPSALLHQWDKLIKKFFGFEPLVFHGAKSKMPIEEVKSYHIVLTTYGMISTRPNKYRSDWVSPLWDVNWDRIIFDEAHHLRNAKSNKHKGAAKLQGDIKWFITGTPIQNSGKDLVSLCKLMGFYDEILENPKNAIDILRKYTLMRNKKQVGLKIEPVENIIIPISSFDSIEEEKLISNIHSMLTFTNVTIENVDEAIAYLKGDSPLPLLVRARQVCIAPTLLSRHMRKLISQGEIPSDINWSPCKTNTKLRIITETAVKTCKDGRILIFCYFMEEMTILKNMLEQNNLTVKMMNGNTKHKERKYIGLPFIKDDDWVDIFANSKFQDSSEEIKSLLMPWLEPDILIVQIQSCCEGLNLQQFNNVFFTSPHWNPALEDQAVCRAHRIGQKKKVKVFKFITEIKNICNSQDELCVTSLDKHCNNVQERKREAIEKFAEDSKPRNVPE